MIITALFVLSALPAAAQRGTGDPFGVAQMSEKPAVITFIGTLMEVDTGPCKSTTGRSFIGTHLMLRTEDGLVNLHLGPAAAVRDEVASLELGMRLKVEAFRTPQLPEDAYVAKSVQHGDEPALVLRDDNLRPTWAGPRGRRAR